MYLNWLINGLVVFFLSMLPIGELRFGIPYGMVFLKVPALWAMLWGIIGNIIPVIFLLKYLDYIFSWLFHHFPYLEHHFKKHFEKLHHKHSLKFNEIGAIFLAVFVAIPMPGTGAWTGALLAYLFAIPFWLAFASITLGIISAGIIVTSFSQTAIWLF